MVFFTKSSTELLTERKTAPCDGSTDLIYRREKKKAKKIGKYSLLVYISSALCSNAAALITAHLLF